MNQIIIKLIYRRNECLFTFASQVDLNVIKEIVKRHLSVTDSLWEDSRLHMIGMSGKVWIGIEHHLWQKSAKKNICIFKW